MNFDLLSFFGHFQMQMQINLRTIDICLIFCWTIFVIVKFEFFLLLFVMCKQRARA